MLVNTHLLRHIQQGNGREVEEGVIANTPSLVKKYFAALAGTGDVMTTYEARCFAMA